MAYFTTTLSTAGGNSNAVAVNWRAFSPVTLTVVSNSSTMTSDFTIQYTLEDLQTSTSQYWMNLSSAVGQVGTHFTSSLTYPDGVTVTFSNPVAAVRLASTAVSSSTLTLKVMQVDHE